MRAVLVPRPEDFSSRLRSPAVAARVGVALGTSFGVCFLTGLLSHYAQQAHQPVPFPTSPSWGYRVTQGLHVVTGTVAVPLLLVKLWTVFPRLFDRLPSLRWRPVLATLLGRGSVAVLVAAAIFQLASGLANSAQWYPWSFDFRASHYAIAWVATGSILLHVAVKLPLIRDALRRDVDDPDQDRPAERGRPAGVLTRRGLLRTTWLAAGLAALAVAGQSVPGLRQVSVFGVRTGDGPQGVPVNGSAEQAGVRRTATDPGWRLRVVHGERSVALSRPDLEAMPQHTESLPIACVEGWSAGATWTGPRVRDVLALVGADGTADVTVSSSEEDGPSYTVNTLPADFASDERTLLALEVNGETLDLDHGYPCRLIAPNRPGVLQTKWLRSLEVEA
jgi:hypothetical protein